MRTMSINRMTIIQWFVGVYFILCFFEPYLNAFGGSYIKYFIVGLMGIIVLSNGFVIRKNRLANYFLAWFFYKCFTVLWTRDYSMVQLHFFTNVTSIMFLYSLCQLPWGKKELDFFANTLWLGSGLIGALTLVSHTAYLGVQSRQVLSLFGQSIDPNNAAAFLAIGCALSLYFMASRKHMFIAALVFIVNTYATLLSGSRGGLLTIAAVCITCACFYLRKGKHRVFLIVGSVILIWSLNYLVYNYLPTNIYERLFIFSSYEGGSERTVIWSNALQLLNTNPLFYWFGAGWGAYYGYNGFKLAMHNTYLSMLCDVGIIGCCLFFLPIIFICWKLWKKRQLMPLLLIVSGLAPSFFLEAINKRFFWNPIYYGVIFYSWIMITDTYDEGIRG